MHATDSHSVPAQVVPTSQVVYWQPRVAMSQLPPSPAVHSESWGWCLHPVSSSQESTVQSMVSSHVGGIPGTHPSTEHDTRPMHGLPS
jgi:hypothetical protein